MPSLLIPNRFIFMLVVIGVILIGIFFHPNKTVLIFVSVVAAITGLSLLAISLRGKRFDEDERLHREFLTLTMQKFLNDLEREGPTKFTSHHLMRAIKNSSTMLGKGGYGSVHKGKFSDGTEVAVKVLHGGISNKRMEEQFMAEVRTSGRVRHFNLVRLLGFCIEEDMTALVYECMENGSLHKYETTLAFEKLYDIAIGMAKGIAYLREGCQERIIHYDIKPGNILLDHNFCPKVADFGLAKLCDRERSHIFMTGQRGTFGYVAPELSNLFVTYKCDVYSFGVLLFKIIESFNIKSEEWFSTEGLEKVQE